MDSEESSIYQLIGKLGDNMISSCDVDEGSKKQLKPLFRKIAFTHLLKKSPRTFSENKHYTEDVGIGLYMLLVQQMAARSKWTDQEYNHISSLTTKLDALLEETKYSWASNICRVLIAIASNRQQETPNCLCLLDPSPKSFQGTIQMPAIFQPPRRFVLSHSIYGKISDHDFLWSNFRNALPQLELPRVQHSQNPITSNFAENERAWFTSTGSSSVDEGFSSPAIPDMRRPFDWSKLCLESKPLFLQWETLGHNFCMCYSPGRKKLADMMKCSPIDLVKIELIELMECIKAMLIGVSSHIFPKIGNKFAMIPGLYTESTTPRLTFLYCKPLRDAGHLFLRLNECVGEYPCVTSTAMSESVNKYISNYIGYVERLQTTNLLQLVLDWIPIIDQLKYLVTLLERKLSKWALVQTLFDQALQIADPNIFYIASSFLIDCSMVYFRLLNQWIFEGKYHDDLFFTQNIPIDEVDDRHCWLTSFSFSLFDAPSLLPSRKIFECGKNNYLVNHIIDKTSEENQPRITVLTDYESCIHMKQTCKHYSGTGEDLYNAVLDLLKCERTEKMRVVSSPNPAVSDSLKWRDEIIAVHEKKAAEKARLYSLFKQEMEQFKKHRRLKELESKLQEILEADRLAYAEFQKVVADYSFRFDVVKRFIEEEERCLKRYRLNIWRAKRFALSTKRQDFFRESELHLEEVDGSSHRTPCDLKISRIPSPSLINVAADGLNPDPESHVHSTPKSSPISVTSEESSSRVVLEKSKTPNNLVCKRINETECTTEGSTIPESQNDLNETTALPDLNVSSLSSADFALNSQQPSPSSTYHDIKSIDDQIPMKCCQERAVVHTKPEVPTVIKLDHHGSVYNNLLNGYKTRVANDVLQPFEPLIRYFTKGKRNVDLEKYSPMPNEEDGSTVPAETFSRSHIHYFLRQSIDYPLNAQIQVTSNYVMHTFFKENDLLGHLKRMRDIFFMNDGVKVMTLSNLLFESMSKKAPHNVLVYTELQNIINFSCLSESEYFALKINHMVEIFDPLDPHLTSCLRLDYITTWPINLIITNKALDRYDAVFSFRLSILRALWYMNKVQVSLMMRRVETKGEHYRKIQVQRHTILHFLNALRFYIGLAVSEGWDTFLKVLCSVRNQDELYAAHVKYLKGVYRRCMLSKQTQRIQNCLSTILRCILMYCQTMLLGEWKHNVINELLHSKFKKLCHLYENFISLLKGLAETLEYFIKNYGFHHFTVLLLPIKNLP